MTDFMSNTTSELDKSSLGVLSQMCKTLIDQREKIEKLEEQLKKEKQIERNISSEDIPNLMLSLGLNSITLDSGESIEIVEDLKVSLPKKDLNKRKAFLKFVIENDGKNIIKNNITIKEPDIWVVEKLKEEKVMFEQKYDINAQTLKAYFKDLFGMKKNSIQRIELKDLPEEVNIFIYKNTKIKGV